MMAAIVQKRRSERNGKRDEVRTLRSERNGKRDEVRTLGGGEGWLRDGGEIVSMATAAECDQLLMATKSATHSARTRQNLQCSHDRGNPR